MPDNDLCNIIIDPLPTSVLVDGREVDISTTFRTGILFEQLMQSDFSHQQKMVSAISLWYPKGLPNGKKSTLIEATERILWFYLCGNMLKNRNADEKPNQNRGFSKRAYDFDVDAPYIYAAFLSKYNIDLQDVGDNLHWWKFCALFHALTDEQEIVKIMGYRTMNVQKIRDRSERERFARLQAKYALPDNRSKEEKESMIGSLFGGSF